VKETLKRSERLREDVPGLAQATLAGQRREDPIGHALSRGKARRGAKKPIRSLATLMIRL
jgi:hypothetical protein